MNGFLLDTNIISELTRPRPEPRVAAWLDSTDEEELFLSVLTLGEIRKGIAMVADSSRKAGLEAWLNRGLIARFEGRLLGIDQSIADRWGQISGMLARRGIALAVIDGLLAATALHHNLTLATRNTRDVEATSASVLDPWTFDSRDPDSRR